MSSKRTALALILIALSAAALWWLFDVGPTDLGGKENQARAEQAARPVTATEQGKAAPAAEAPEANRRQALETESAPVAATGSGAILGKVVDEEGHPLPGAKVACTPAMGPDPANLDPASIDWEEFTPAQMVERSRERLQDRVEALTDAQGGFRLLPKGKGPRLDLSIRARGHVQLEQNIERPRSADVDLGPLAVKNGGIVSGRVVERSGQPIAGALVMRSIGGMAAVMPGLDEIEMPGMDQADAFPGMGDQARTDADGRFELPHLAPGELSLRARHPEHPLARLDGLTLLAGQTLADLVITADAAATIRGRVSGVPEQVKSLRVLAAQKRAPVDPATAGPMAMLGVDPGDLLAETGMEWGERSSPVAADGTFTLRGLHADRTYRIWAAQSGRGFAGNTPCSQRLEVTAGTDGAELRYEAGITVTFRVVNDKDGAPLERLWVDDQLKGGGNIMDFMGAFAGGAGKSRNYPDGMVTIANLRPKPKQTLTLRVEALGFARLEREGIAVPATGALDLGTLRLTPQPVVRVHVISGGAPVAGARVSLRQAGDDRRMPDFMGLAAGGASRSSTTGIDGNCTLNGMPGTKVVLAVDSKQHAPWSSEAVDLPAGEDWKQVAELVRGGSVQVLVAAADGRPATGIQVEHRTPDGQRDRRPTDASGQATFDRLAPGRHAFRPGGRAGNMDMMAAWRNMAGGGRDETGWETVEVQDGNRAELKLQPRPAAAVTGIVRENGAPLAGARVAFQEGTGEDVDPGNELMAAMGDMPGMSGMGGRSARTDADGRYRLKDLPPGEHRLQITHKDRAMPALVRVSLGEGDNTCNVDLDVTVLRGIVRDGDGKAIAGASVEAMAVKDGEKGQDQALRSAMRGALGALGSGGGNRSHGRTDDQGRFELRGTGNAQVVVRAQAKGYAAGTSAPVDPAHGADVILVLQAAGSIRVQAANAGMFAAVEATWAGAESDGVEPVFAMLRNGNATLSGLRAGTWTIQLNTTQDHGSQKRTVEVSVGQTVDLAF